MLGFIVALGAGFLTPYIEAPVAQPVARKLQKHIKIDQTEIRLIAFMIVLLGAGIVASLMNTGSAFWISLGLCLGYFATRGVAALRDFAQGKDLDD